MSHLLSELELKYFVVAITTLLWGLVLQDWVGVTLRSSQSHVAGGLWQGLQNTSIPQKHKADVLQGCTQNQSQLGKQAMVFFARQLSATLAEDGIFRTFPESETID